MNAMTTTPEQWGEYAATVDDVMFDLVVAGEPIDALTAYTLARELRDASTEAAHRAGLDAIQAMSRA